MAEELDTSWFDLKKYDALNSLDLSGWHTQLLKRSYIQNYSKYQHMKESVNEWTTEIKNNPVLESTHSKDHWLEHDHSRPYNTYSVFGTPASFFWARVEGTLG